jgi:hypothetical protein
MRVTKVPPVWRCVVEIIFVLHIQPESGKRKFSAPIVAFQWEVSLTIGRTVESSSSSPYSSRHNQTRDRATVGAFYLSVQSQPQSMLGAGFLMLVFCISRAPRMRQLENQAPPSPSHRALVNPSHHTRRILHAFRHFSAQSFSLSVRAHIYVYHHHAVWKMVRIPGPH